MKYIGQRWFGLWILFLGLRGFGQSGPPPLPPTPIAEWGLAFTNWDTTRDFPPRAFANLNTMDSWEYEALSVDTNLPAFLNFYSSGEEVLRAWYPDPPTNVLTAAPQTLGDDYYSQSPLGCFVRVWQEKAKGIAANSAFLGSDHGGWKFNTNYDSGTNLMTPGQAALLTTNQLQTNASFDFGSTDFANDCAVEGSLGNVYAFQFDNRMLGDAIPALSFPTGANPVPNPGIVAGNFDMQGGFENGWASGRGQVRVGASAAGEWHHGDYEVVAYTYTYKLFGEMVTLGNLK
jgi:hypothetical protein